MNILVLTAGFFLALVSRGSGAADYEVERVNSPYVETMDLGPMMSSEGTQRISHTPRQTHPRHGANHHRRPCLTCHHGMGISSGFSTSGGSSARSSYGSSSFNYGGMSGNGAIGSNPMASQPLGSSTRHEIKKEQEFVNGQQVYDFHHEKKYQDGKLIKEKRYENAPDELEAPAEAPGYQSYNGGSSLTSSSSMGSLSQGNAFGALPQTGYHQNLGHSDMGAYDFSEQFQSEVERLREELRRKTVGIPDQPLANIPNYGSSHKTEFRTESKYVNGKPVYVRNEERKYKDGTLVHNVTEEKGPDDLGTSDIIYQGSQLTSPTGRTYSSHHENVIRDQTHMASHPSTYQSSYPSYYSSEFSNTDNVENNYGSSAYGSHSETSRYPVSSSSIHLTNSNNIESNSSPIGREQPYYQPTSVYSSQVTEERKASDTHKLTGYPSNRYPNPYDTDDDLDYAYRPAHRPDSYGTSRYRPEGNYYRTTTPTTTSTTTTTTTTPRPRLDTYNYLSTYDRDNQSPTYNQDTLSRNQYNQESKYYSNRHTTATQRPYYTAEETRRQYEETYGRENQSPTHNQDSLPINPYDNEPKYYPSNTRATITQRPYYNAEETRRQYEETYASNQNHNSYGQRLPSTTTEPSNIGHRPGYPSSPYGRGTYSKTEEKIKEASQSSYYDSKPNRPTEPYSSFGGTRNQVHVVDQNKVSSYRPGVHQSSYSENREAKIIGQAPYHERRITETSQHHPNVQTSLTQEERRHRVSSEYYPNTPDSQRPRNSYSEGTPVDYNNRDKNYDNNPRGVGSPTSNFGVPGFISGPEFEPETDSEEEQERYDISPYDDASEFGQPEDEAVFDGVQFEKYPSRSTGRDSQFGVSSSHSYDTTDRHSGEHSHHYNYESQSLPNPDRLGSSSVQREYEERVTTTIPSSWVETKTVWKFVNGILAGETQYHKYYENGVVHENTTERTRDQMERDGVNVRNIDLSPTELSRYGSSLTSNAHSQKHELHQVKRYKDGQQIYELNHEQLFQDGNLVDENRDEKNEEDFGTFTSMSGNHHLTQTQLNQHGVNGANKLHTAGFIQTNNPSGYVRRHEVRQEEEFINGQKVYDLHHEREYQDGKLIRENKDELGPDDLGSHGFEHRDALKDLLSGRTHSSNGQSALLEQQKTSNNILTTSCVTCGGAHESSSHHSSGSVLGSLGLPPSHGYQGGSTYRQDLNVEEHYENGQLVKGKEEAKKWVNGQLIDEKSKHYFDGPSRTNLTTHRSGSSAALASAPIGQVRKSGNLEGDCVYNPCRHNGTCKTSLRGPVCVCPFGFKGKHCEEAYCPKRFCRHGGTCSLSDGMQVCDCPEKYTGHRCTTRIHKIRVGVSG